jgi:branched-chain amino acid transport system substrate-binding protein
VVLIALGIVVIVRLESIGDRIVVEGQINEEGRVVRADSAPANPEGNGQAVCPPLSIAMAGALTGADVEAGINIRNGVQLAIEKHNAANRGCQVQIKEFDTGGDPQRVNDYAPQIVSDAYTVGLIGPTFSGVAQAAGAIFEANKLPAATASASRSSLSQQGWTTFFRAVASDEVQGRAVAGYLVNTLRYDKVCVVSDNTPYGNALTSSAAGTLAGRVLPECQLAVTGDQQQDNKMVELIKAARPNAILYGGSYAESRSLLSRLRDAGVTAAFISVQGQTDPQFLRDAAHDVLLFFPFGPDPDWFMKEYRAKFGRPPGAYSAEGYDLATIMLRGIDNGMLTRGQLLDWMRQYNGQGIARRYQWTSTGELTEPTVWMYRVH